MSRRTYKRRSAPVTPLSLEDVNSTPVTSHYSRKVPNISLKDVKCNSQSNLSVTNNNREKNNQIFFAQNPAETMKQTSYSNSNTPRSITTPITPATPGTPFDSSTNIIKDNSVMVVIRENDEEKIIEINKNNNKNDKNIDNINKNYDNNNDNDKNNDDNNEKKENKKEIIRYSPTKILKEKRYILNSKIIDTLQGNIWKAKDVKNGDIVVIKITNKKLHKKGITLRHGRITRVQENILKEKDIMETLQNQKPPRGFIKILDFFKDRKNYFLVMEFGGQDFFSWITSNHEKIKTSELGLKEWKRHVQILFCQMCNLVYFLHETCNCCHLDISLENMLIKNVKLNKKTGKFLNHGQIFFCDFGLAEIFNNDNNYTLNDCIKFVGKSQYKSPEVYGKRKFNAKKADCYSLIICLFMMTIGAPPYEKPSFKDATFKFIWNGYLKILLKQWKRHSYMTEDIYDLFDNIICPESKRFDITDILKHKYVKHTNKKLYKYSGDNLLLYSKTPRISRTSRNSQSSKSTDLNLDKIKTDDILYTNTNKKDSKKKKIRRSKTPTKSNKHDSNQNTPTSFKNWFQFQKNK